MDASAGRRKAAEQLTREAAKRRSQLRQLHNEFSQLSMGTDELFLTIVDENFSAEVERVEAMLGDGEDPESQAREAAVDFIRSVNADPEWSRLFFEFTVRAARDPEFREHLAGRYDTLRNRLVAVYESWSAGFPTPPPLPLEQVATMTYCMANGFLAEQMIEPDIPDELYGSMMAVFFRGLQGMAADDPAG